MDRRKFLGAVGIGSAAAAAAADGSIDLQTGTGLVAALVLAGPPSNQAGIGIPGMTRLVRSTKAASTGSLPQLKGVVEDRSAFAAGENARTEFVLGQEGKQPCGKGKP